MKNIIAACTDSSEKIMNCAFGNNKDFVIIKNKSHLDRAVIDAKRIFVVHWHWRIPEWIYTAHPTVGFHMTDLPWGRGPSPLRRLRRTGFDETLVTAFKVVKDFDAGPILMKRVLDLRWPDEYVLQSAYVLCAEMIDRLVTSRHSPMYIEQGQWK